jgi:hypothetical protein
MSVAQGGSIFVPYVCALYTCECGRRGVSHGVRSGSPPKGWETWTAERHVCDVCCGKVKAGFSAQT